MVFNSQLGGVSLDSNDMMQESPHFSSEVQLFDI